MSVQLETEDHLVYFRKTSGSLHFRIRATSDARIALSSRPSTDPLPIFEILIGGGKNTKSVIRKNDQPPVEVVTPEILNGEDFRGFWIRWNSGTVSVGHEDNDSSFLNFYDNEEVHVEYVGVSTAVAGSWIIKADDGTVQPYRQRSRDYSGLCWVPAKKGEVPRMAVVGGEDLGEPLFVVRAKVEGRYIPGKLLVRYGLSYIPWGGEEQEVAEYEVLCYYPKNCKDYNPLGIVQNTDYEVESDLVDYVNRRYEQEGLRWVTANNGAVPPNAVIGGENDDLSDLPVYIIRAKFKGSWTPGKLLPSHGTSYVSWGGEIHAVSKYEVLCYFYRICHGCCDDYFPPNAIPVRVEETGYNPLECIAQPRCQDYFGLWWVKARNGEAPPNAVIGGEDQGEPLYVIRANLKGNLTPGKLLVRYALSYVPWGGKEHEMADYEVLCYFPGNCHACCVENTPTNAQRACVKDCEEDCNAVQPYKQGNSTYSGLCWVMARHGKVPANAVVGGEENDQPLYVVRAKFRGNLTPGKLVPGHEMSYVSWGGREYGNFKYEVLCYYSKKCTVCDKGYDPPNAEPARVDYNSLDGTALLYKQKVDRYFGLCWMEARHGRLPPNAVVGGEDMGEPVYVIRAKFKGSWTPGKMLPSHSASYVPWGGKEHGMFKYEVLCYFPGNCGHCKRRNIPRNAHLANIEEVEHPVVQSYWQEDNSYFGLCWVKARKGKVPPNAVVGGEDLGEPLYVVRAKFKGSYVPGKLLVRYGLCYVPWGGAEHEATDYEVLCYFPGNCEVCYTGSTPPNAEQALIAGAETRQEGSLNTFYVGAQPKSVVKRGFWKKVASLFKTCLKRNEKTML